MSIAIGALRPGRRTATWGERRALRRRRMLASAYRRVLHDARRPPRGLSARIPLQREQVFDAAADIERLIARLDDVDRPVNDEGIAGAIALLRDGCGPLFGWAEPGTLRRRVRVICEAVE